MLKVDKYRYKFIENDIEVIAEEHTLIALAKALREAQVEGTWSDLAYQIEYAFDIDGVRSEDEESQHLDHQYVLAECERQWHENQEETYGTWDSQSDDTKAEYYNDMYQHLKFRNDN